MNWWPRACNRRGGRKERRAFRDRRKNVAAPSRRASIFQRFVFIIRRVHVVAHDHEHSRMTKRSAFVLFPTASIRRAKYSRSAGCFRAFGLIFAVVPAFNRGPRASPAFPRPSSPRRVIKEQFHAAKSLVHPSKFNRNCRYAPCFPRGALK